MNSAEHRGEWQEFFDQQAPQYDENSFAKHTVAEVDFLLSLFALSAGQSVLDVGCGTGRHSVELARRGFRVTGVDFSEGMLSQGRRKASAAGTTVNFIQADVTEWRSEFPFDAAICVCEGGVGLIDRLEDAESHDLSIFENIWSSLSAGAPFLLTSLNGYSTIRQMKDEFIADGRFDPATMFSNYQDQWDLPGGPQVVTIRERLFIPPEVVKMLRSVGFEVDNVYGGTAGHWERRPVSLDEVEVMYVCRKGPR
jgi:cyclopropane fatty-acyl-phospholipid synthase-like methyltransferase